VTVHGTLAYAAPEVLAGERADQRVDVYGLGAVLYELLTGRPPFTGEDVPARLRVVRPPAPSIVDASVPTGIDETVLRCLDRDPAVRPASAGTLAEELRRLAAYLPSERPPSAVTTPLAPRTDGTRRLPTPTATDALPAGRTRHRSRRRRGRVIGALVAMSAIAAAVAVAGPALLRLDDPVAATVGAPPALPAPATLDAATSCDGFLATGSDLAWSGVEGATAYEVWRRNAAGESWGPVTTVSSAVTALRDPDLAIDALYVYRVRALDGPLPGRWSSAVTARTPLFCLT
jgi:serine/threonine-protein kinase